MVLYWEDGGYCLRDGVNIMIAFFPEINYYHIQQLPDSLSTGAKRC